MSNKNKTDFLGMPIGTANNRLRKMIMFELVKQLGYNVCHQCHNQIETIEELSVEHIKPWLNVDAELFWDLENIAFSHLSCNCRAADHSNVGRKLTSEHGTSARYRYGCRCKLCGAAKVLENSKRVR